LRRWVLEACNHEVRFAGFIDLFGDSAPHMAHFVCECGMRSESREYGPQEEPVHFVSKSVTMTPEEFAGYGWIQTLEPK
jgi:hypothetical protein